QMVPMPTTNDGRHENTTFISGLALTNVTNDNKQRELAWELMKFIVGDDDEQAMQLVASNTLIHVARRFPTKPFYEQLMTHLRSESEKSRVSTVYLVPTYTWVYSDH